MQEQIRDSILSTGVITQDSISLPRPIFIESRPASHLEFRDNLHATSIIKNSIPDWYFISIILVLSVVAWTRIVYGKFLNSVLVSAFNYQTATKVYKEQSIVQKRFRSGLDFLYLINLSLFLFLLNRYFSPGIFRLNEFYFVSGAFILLFTLVLIRTIVMRFTAFIFKQSEFFLEFLYHFFIYNKVLSILLLPFLIAIPYTQGILQETLVYIGISVVIIVQIIRLFRVIIYLIKHVVLFFYLILYLCILELLPVMVIIKLLLSLAQF